MSPRLSSTVPASLLRLPIYLPNILRHQDRSLPDALRYYRDGHLPRSFRADFQKRPGAPGSLSRTLAAASVTSTGAMRDKVLKLLWNCSSAFWSSSKAARGWLVE